MRNDFSVSFEVYLFQTYSGRIFISGIDGVAHQDGHIYDKTCNGVRVFSRYQTQDAFDLLEKNTEECLDMDIESKGDLERVKYLLMNSFNDFSVKDGEEIKISIVWTLRTEPISTDNYDKILSIVDEFSSVENE